MTGLLDLGEDVIAGNLIPLLDVRDIRSLGQTCRFMHSIVDQGIVWREVYQKSFGKQPTPYSLSEFKWPELFRLRQHAKLYSWGKYDGRLGLKIDKSAPRNAAVSYKPCLVDRFHVPLADVICGGFSLQILTSDGELYCTGYFERSFSTAAPGPLPMPPSDLPDLPDWGLRFPPTIPQLRGHHSSNVRPMPDVARAASRINKQASTSPKKEPKVDCEEGFLFRLKCDKRILAISSGRTHVLALDEDGEVWTWDSRHLRDHHGVKLRFPGINGPVLKIRAGWNMSTLYVQGVGIVVWMLREPGTDEADALYTVVPNTAATEGPERVVDYLCLEREIVILEESGRLVSFAVSRHDAEKETRLGDFSVLTARFASKLPRTDKIVRLSGSFRTVAAMTQEDRVLIARKETTIDALDPVAYPELQRVQCVSVAVGDWHYLALLKSGKLLSWGINNGGCLGVGDTVLKRLDSPTEVDVDGKVLAIAAGGWQSAAIVAKE